MRLEDRNVYVTGAELTRIVELKDDADALARYLGPDVCTAIQDELGPGPNPVLDGIPPRLRWLRGLTIVVEPMAVLAPVNQPG